MSRFAARAGSADDRICQKCSHVELKDIDIEKLCKIIHELLRKPNGIDFLTEKLNDLRAKGETRINLNTDDGPYNCKISDVLFCVIKFIEKYKSQIDSIRDIKKPQFNYFMARIAQIILDNQYLFPGGLSRKVESLILPVLVKGVTAKKEIGDEPITIRNCRTCGNTSLKKHLLNCECKKVNYCDKECQKADWKRHREEHRARDVDSSKP